MTELPSEFTDLRIVRDNQRYISYQAIYDDVAVFIKQAKGAGFTNGIRRELWGLDAFGQLVENNDLGFMVPRIIAGGDDYIVTSWTEGVPIHFNSDAPDYDQHIEFFASSLAKVDILTRFASPMQAKFDMASVTAAAGIEKLKHHLSKTDYADYVSQGMIDKSFAYLYKNISTLEARLTHADFTPENVLEHNGTKTLIDYESVSLLWPRFYDLVNLTLNRMVAEPDNVSGCRQIIKRYFDINNTIDFESAILQMNVLATIRALSLIWEFITEPNNDHNTRESMTHERGEKLSTVVGQIMLDVPYFEAF